MTTNLYWQNKRRWTWMDVMSGRAQFKSVVLWKNKTNVDALDQRNWFPNLILISFPNTLTSLMGKTGTLFVFLWSLFYLFICWFYSVFLHKIFNYSSFRYETNKRNATHRNKFNKMIIKGIANKQLAIKW